MMRCPVCGDKLEAAFTTYCHRNPGPLARVYCNREETRGGKPQMRWTIRGFGGALDELELFIVIREDDELPVALIQGWFQGEYVTGSPQTIHPSFALSEVRIQRPEKLEALVRHLLQRYLISRKTVRDPEREVDDGVVRDPDTEHSGPGSYDWMRGK